MALALSLLGAGFFSTSNTTDYTHGAVTPAASCGIVVAVQNSIGTGSAETPSLDSPTWLDGSWTQESTQESTPVGDRITVFSGRSVSSPGSDDLVVSFSASHTGCNIVIIQITDEDTSDFVLQPKSANNGGATSVSITLDNALAAATSVCLAFMGHRANEAQSPTGSETELVDSGHSAPVRRMSAQYEVNDTTSGASWATSAPNWIIAMEIKEAAAVPTFVAPPSRKSALAIARRRM